VSADGRTGDGAGILLIFLMIFFKKYVILLFQNERVCWEWFFYQKKNQADFCKTTLKLLFAIKI
jgi:hypothetical protein